MRHLAAGNRNLLAVVVALAALACPRVCTSFEFESFRTYALGDTVCIVCVTAMATADVDGDGSLDVVASVQTPTPPFTSSILVAPGNAGGDFSSWTRYWASSATEPYALTVGDFNNDGHVDACTANLSTSNLSIFYGAGNGTFAWSHNVPTISFPASITSGDLNADGFDDLFVASWTSDLGQALLGDGQGGFTASTTLTIPGSPGAPRIADVTGDGNPDVVLTTAAAGEIRVYLGSGTGNLVPTPLGALSTGSNPLDLIVTDLNGDLALDFATANATSGTVSIIFGNGTGGVLSTATLAAGASPSALTATDLDGDSHVDLVVASEFNGDGAVLLGTGGGSFTPAGPLNIGQLPLGLVANDFDNDGTEELIALLGVNAIATVDVLASGELQQPLYLPSGTGTIDAAVGDVNGDGASDVVSVAEGGDLTVHLRQLSGGFQTTTIDISPVVPVEVILSDADGDGDLDALVLQRSPGSVTLFAGDGSGGFALGPQVMTGFTLTALSQHDIDGDGNSDVLAIDAGNDLLLVALATGMGLAPPSSYSTPLIPVALAVADFDGDSFPDVTVLTQGTLSSNPTLYLLRGSATGALAPAVTVLTLTEIGHDLVAGDFDNDGLVDLAATTGVQNPIVQLLLGDGMGGFTVADSEVVGGGLEDLLAADLDDDGTPELVVVSTLESPVGIIRTASGTLEPPIGIGVGAAPVAVTAADVDGDGQRDLAVACEESNTVALLFNRTQSAVPLFRRGDLSGNGSLAIDDAILVLSYLFVPGSNVDCPDSADTNDDGALNLVDAVLLLNALFTPNSPPPAPPYPFCGADPTPDSLGSCVTSPSC